MSADRFDAALEFLAEHAARALSSKDAGKVREAVADVRAAFSVEASDGYVLREALTELVGEFRSNVDWSNGRSNYGDNAAWDSAARQVDELLAEHACVTCSGRGVFMDEECHDCAAPREATVAEVAEAANNAIDEDFVEVFAADGEGYASIRHLAKGVAAALLAAFDVRVRGRA